KPIAQHQAIQFKLADMATKVEAARLLTLKAARMKDAGERSDLEAGMAKLFASEAGKEVVEDSFRIHGGYGYSKEDEIERLYRDDTLVLETDFHTADGAVRIVDCMPPRGEAPDVVRLVQGLEGRVEIDMELILRFDYGHVVPWLRAHGETLLAVAGPDAVRLD